MWNSNHNFPAFSILFSVSLYKQFLWENSRTWNISTQSWDTNICVGWTRCGSIPKLPNKREASTRKGCLKVQITLFWCCQSIKSTHITQNVVSCENMGQSHFCPKPAKFGCFGHNLWTTDPKWMFFCWNHIVLWCLIQGKRLQPQILNSLEVNGSCMPKIFPNWHACPWNGFWP